MAPRYEVVFRGPKTPKGEPDADASATVTVPESDAAEAAAREFLSTMVPFDIGDYKLVSVTEQ